MTSAYQDDNIFAKILRGEIPSVQLFDLPEAIGIMDVMPQSAGHCLVIPKAASRNLLDARDEDLAPLLPIVARLARAVKTGLQADGVVISQFNEAPAGQTVFHLHIHVIPHYDGVALKRHGGAMEDISVLSEQATRIRAAFR
ncbi:HIT domain-containing protein [Aureimonas frigidaquae]|uniref:HIT family protein n=1 Tax=Aureimonas frigidaquae TaxID=424757 RepID=A0A0P0Z3D2_9HYPH|nr:HIT domain-containing protein [Aureimonas frigidaquae]BAT28389.1 HIT family protein [Aureimonas frigidaquae]